MSVADRGQESETPRMLAILCNTGANGYEGYFGTFDVNEAAHSVTHHVQGALVRSVNGKDLTRIYTFSGKQLVLTSSRPDESWRDRLGHYLGTLRRLAHHRNHVWSHLSDTPLQFCTESPFVHTCSLPELYETITKK